MKDSNANNKKKIFGKHSKNKKTRIELFKEELIVVIEWLHRQVNIISQINKKKDGAIFNEKRSKL